MTLLQSTKTSEGVKISDTNPAEILLFVNLLYLYTNEIQSQNPLISFFSFPSCSSLSWEIF